MKLELHRVAVKVAGAYGVLLDAGGYPFAVTLEPTYELEGEPRPKIPIGLYACTRTIFHRGGYPTYEIHVPGHSRLLFHRGNVAADSEGCVLVAESFGQLKGQIAIMDSVGGFGEFMRVTHGESQLQLAVTGVES